MLVKTHTDVPFQWKTPSDLLKIAKKFTAKYDRPHSRKYILKYLGNFPYNRFLSTEIFLLKFQNKSCKLWQYPNNYREKRFRSKCNQNLMVSKSCKLRGLNPHRRNFRFVALPLEFSRKKLSPPEIQQNSVTPLGIPRSKTKTHGNSVSFSS